MNDKIRQNLIQDRKKQEFTPEEWAGIIQEELKVRKITSYKLAQLEGLNRATIDEWLVPLKPKYKELRKEGFNHTDALNIVANRKRGLNKINPRKVPKGLSSIYTRLSDLKPEDIEDWGRLELIKEVVDELLRNKPNGGK